MSDPIMLAHIPSRKRAGEAKRQITSFLQRYLSGGRIPTTQESMSALGELFVPFPRPVRIDAVLRVVSGFMAKEAPKAHGSGVDRRQLTDVVLAPPVFAALRLMPGEMDDETLFWFVCLHCMDYVFWRWAKNPDDVQDPGNAIVVSHALSRAKAIRENAIMRLVIGIERTRRGPELYPDFFRHQDLSHSLGDYAYLRVRGMTGALSRYYSAEKPKWPPGRRDVTDLFGDVNGKFACHAAESMVSCTERNADRLKQWVKDGENLDPDRLPAPAGPDDFRVTDESRLLPILATLDSTKTRFRT